MRTLIAPVVEGSGEGVEDCRFREVESQRRRVARLFFWCVSPGRSHASAYQNDSRKETLNMYSCGVAQCLTAQSDTVCCGSREGRCGVILALVLLLGKSKQ